MEEWIKYWPPKFDKCYSMNFKIYDKVKHFKVVGLDSSGKIKALDCDDKSNFEFNHNNILKIDYSTIREINCQCS